MKAVSQQADAVTSPGVELVLTLAARLLPAEEAAELVGYSHFFLAR